MTDSHVIRGESVARTSSTLLDRVRARDQAAWRRMVGLYTPLVYRWCRQGGLQAADAADVGQEVFVAVARAIGGFRKNGTGGTFRAWLRTITANKIRDHFRSRGVVAPAAGGAATAWFLHVPAGEREEIDPAADADERRLLRRRAVEMIRGDFGERTWLAFWRTAVEGRRPDDVAAELHMTMNAVYLAKSRILRRLREELGDLPAD